MQDVKLPKVIVLECTYNYIFVAKNYENFKKHK